METKRSRFISIFKDYNSIVILLLLLLISSFAIDGMATSFDRVLQEASIYGLIAVGLSLVMITGNIDLSIGFQAAACAIVTVIMTNITNGNYPVVFLTAVAAGIIMGCLNGFVVVRLGINPLIATIAMNYIYKGIVYYYTKDGAFRPEGDLRNGLKSAFYNNYILNQKVLCITILVLLFAIVILHLILRKTRLGTGMYIAGDNAEAGILAGINIKKLTWLAYILCGACCAIAGVFFASRSGSAIYSQGEGREVFAISACVIGGIKMAGGKGTMINVLVGLLIMRLISTAMDMLMVPAAWVDFVSGVLLIVILIIDRLTTVKK